MADDFEVFDPYDMNKEDFNPGLCMLKYIKECELQQLLTRKNHLDGEIISLTSQMQGLVYDNYKKCITASNTISNSKTYFDTMSSEVDSLSAKLNTIVDTSSSILQTLNGNEQKLRGLLKSKEILIKLRSLTELNADLQKLLASGSYVAAAKHYLTFHKLLVKYNFLHRTKADCDVTMVVVKAKLKENLDFVAFSDIELSECMILLLQLGETPVATELVLISRASDVLKSNLSVSVDLSTTEAPNSENSYADLNIQELTAIIDKHIKIIKTVIGCYRNVFTKSNREYITEILESFIRVSMQEILVYAQQKLSVESTKVEDICLANALDKIYRIIFELVTIIPQLGLRKESNELILNICHSRCEFYLQSMKETFDSYLLKILEDLLVQDYMSSALIALKKEMKNVIKSSLSSLLCYIQPECKYARDAYFRKIFCKIHIREGVLVALIRHMNQNAIDHCAKNKRENFAKLSLLLSKYFMDMYENDVSDFICLVESYFNALGADFNTSAVSELELECKNTAHKLLNFYIQRQQMKLSLMFRISSENINWTEFHEPRQVRSVIRRFLEDLRALKTDIGELYLEAKYQRNECGNKYSDIFCKERKLHHDSTDNSALNISIKKLFTQTSNDSESRTFTNESILYCIIRYVFKSFLEFVRLQTYNFYGFQQIHVDVVSLQIHLQKLLRNEGQFHVLFEDILTSSSNRTLNPQLVHRQVIENICKNL